MSMGKVRDKLATGLVLAGSAVAAAAMMTALAAPLSASMTSTMLTTGIACAGAVLSGGCMRAVHAARELLEANRKWLNMSVETESVTRRQMQDPTASRNASVTGRVSLSFANSMENALKGCADVSTRGSARQAATLAPGMND